MLRIPVDFNTMAVDEQERVLINVVFNEKIVNDLKPGLRVVLYDETLEVAATVEYDVDDRRWWATPDWSTSRDLPYSQTPSTD